MSAGWITGGEFRAVQNYATKMVLLQPENGATTNAVGVMAAQLKLFPFEAWPASEPGTPSGHPDRVSPIYYMQGAS